MFPFLAGYVTLLFVGGVIFRDTARGKTDPAEVKFSGTADFLSTTLLFGFSMLVAAAPWLYGSMMWLILPLQFLLAGILLVSAWHNQSPFAIVSGGLFSSFSQCREAWLVWFKTIGLTIPGVLIGGFLLDLNYTGLCIFCLLYTSPSPRDATLSRMPSSA